MYLSRKEDNERVETSLCMLGHVLRCHTCSLSSVRFCQSDSMSSEPVCEVSKKLLDLEQRSVIKFLNKEGKKPKEIYERMVAVYGESALLTTV